MGRKRWNCEFGLELALAASQAVRIAQALKQAEIEAFKASQQKG